MNARVRPPFAAPDSGPEPERRGHVLRAVERSDGVNGSGHARRQEADCLAEEAPVALIINGRPQVVMMATPSELEPFALGFLLSEAIIATPDELLGCTTLQRDNGHELHLRIPETRAAALVDRRRNLPGRSGCGLCGSETIAEAMRVAPRVPAGLPIDSRALHRALQALREHQPINAMTGATHAAGFADRDGRLLRVHEDIGRHNALDKLIGALAQAGIDPARGFAVISSRASYEMVLKAATVGIPLLAAISAPTALAVQIAEDAGLTLVGYARAGRHVVYACPARLVESASTPTPGAASARHTRRRPTSSLAAAADAAVDADTVGVAIADADANTGIATVPAPITARSGARPATRQTA